MKTNLPKRNAKIIALAWLMGAMLFGSSTVFAQVKTVTSPTTIDSNLEVETPGGNKVKVHKMTGKLTIKDGTEGMGKVFTSDAVGEGSWENTPVTVFSGTVVPGHWARIRTAPHNQLDHRVDLTPEPGYTAGWDPTAKQFMLPQDGYYRVEAGLSCIGSGALSGTLQLTWIWSSDDGGGAQSSAANDITVTSADWQSVVWSGKWAGGSTVSLLAVTIPARNTTNSTYDGQCNKGYMNITKIR